MERWGRRNPSYGMNETLEDSSADYVFLRNNGVHAKTALRMLALAYMGKKGGVTNEG
ncbi:hypothetical protein KAW18_17445 [candidate division WOR-3 bacterium]|nr:hypothetical protein [candidate division WOR-3 bacterium]